MNKGALVFARGVSRYAGSYPALSFSHWDQLLCMLFAQFTSRASLRDITICLRSHSAKLYRAGFRGGIARSTLADTNERRDCRIFEEFALHLIGHARVLYADDSNCWPNWADRPWAASGRAIANGRDEGVTKLLFDDSPEAHGHGKILGGGMVGTHAGDMIGEIALAIEMGADALDIGKTIHPHPTLGESIGMAAEVAHGSCTDLPPVRK